MAWNGLGSFLRLFSWANDATNGLPISSSRMDSEFANYKGGLENCITRNGENQPVANLPMGGNKHIAVGAATLRDQYAQAAQVQDGAFIWGGTAGGTANALTIALTPAITAYVTGQTFRFVTSLANTGAATIAINGLAATAITKENGAALIAGDLPAGAIIEIVKTATDFRVNGLRGSALVGIPGASVSGVGLLAAANTWTGLNLFTASTGVSLQASQPFIQYRDTSQALPNGLWAAQAVTTGWRIVKNTAVAGDFSTSVNPLFIDNSNNVSFVGRASGSNAVAASDFATKGQVDAKVYGGLVAGNGAALVLPPGWSCSRTSLGTYVVTHNLGVNNYGVVASVDGIPGLTIFANGGSTTAFLVLVTTAATGAAADGAFGFVLARN
jgi:hypothetical protein